MPFSIRLPTFVCIICLLALTGCLERDSACYFYEHAFKPDAQILFGNKWKAQSAIFIVNDPAAGINKRDTLAGGHWEFFPEDIAHQKYSGHLTVTGAPYHNGTYPYKIDECHPYQIIINEPDTGLDGTTYHTSSQGPLWISENVIDIKGNYPSPRPLPNGGTRFLVIKLVKQ